MDSQLYASYLQVIAEVPNFVTDSSAQAGNRGTYKYLSLSTLLQRVKPVFAQHGIMFRQEVVNTPSDAGKMQLGEVRTIVFDADGNDIQVGAYPFVVSADPQAIGSAVTYARRYSLYAALGISRKRTTTGQRHVRTARNRTTTGTLRPSPAWTRTHCCNSPSSAASTYSSSPARPLDGSSTG